MTRSVSSSPVHGPRPSVRDNLILRDIQCPLCGSECSVPIHRIPYREIWNRLESDWGAIFSPEVVARHTPCEETTIARCVQCGLEYFQPMIAADAPFYEELTKRPVYNSSTWEFQLVEQKLSTADTVLDVGCGEGAFLRAIRAKVARAAGWDYNRRAIERLETEGIEVLSSDSEANREAFDVVCCFQVIEHVARVRQFLELPLRWLRPGGRLFVSVPNRERRFRQALEPFDCPPHHVSRWSAPQLEKLGDNLGMELRTLTFELCSVEDARLLLKDVTGRFLRRLGADPNEYTALWAGRLLSRALLTKNAYSLYRMMGWLERWKLYRHSMLGEFIKRVDRKST